MYEYSQILESLGYQPLIEESTLVEKNEKVEELDEFGEPVV